MDFSPENISGLLIRSKLMSPDQTRSMYERWLKEGKKENLKSTPHYLKWIVANKLLTEYQAALIARGHADNFFLGKYKIIDRLGKGRMAGVYKALHQLGQIVAIKVLPPSKGKDPQMLARFEREGRLAMSLKHPNVVRTFQIAEADGLHFMVMEHLDGETLEDVVARRKKLPVNEAVRVVYQALQGLQHIHEKGFVHRDMKPANLMLVPARIEGEPDTTLSSTVKILDIGLGREMFDETARAAMQDLELTGEGMLLGTPDYLAPEQARDPRHTDIRADIYGLGCVLFHCLAGQPPFPDKNVLNQMVRHATEEPKPVKEFNRDVPDGLQQVLNWMLAKSPDKRYPTPERAAKALQVFMVAGGAKVERIEDLPQMRRYLTWLESKDNDNSPPPAARLESKSDRQARPSDKSKKDSKRERRSQPPSKDKNDLPVARPSTPALGDDVDVELVSLSTPAAIVGAGVKFYLPQSLRDWILIGAGAGAIAIAIFFGYLMFLIKSFLGF